MQKNVRVSQILSLKVCCVDTDTEVLFKYFIKRLQSLLARLSAAEFCSEILSIQDEHELQTVLVNLYCCGHGI